MYKNVIILLSISALVLCNKKAQLTNPLLGNSSDKMSGRIATVTNNMQTKYGTFTGAATVEGVFKQDLKINFFEIGDYDIEKRPTGMFFNSTTSDDNFERKFTSFYGNPLEISVNGNQLKKMPVVPYANVVTLRNGIESRMISKSKGITLNWKIRKLTSSQNNVTNNFPIIRSLTLSPDPIDIPSQVSGVQ